METWLLLRTVRRTAALMLAASIVSLLAGQSARAATFSYTRTISNTSGTPDQWSAGTNWSAIPLSAIDTTLTLGGVSLASGATIFTKNDNLGDFKLNAFNFTYAGPGSGGASTVTVSGNRVEFISNGGTTPVLTVNSTGTVKPTLTISNELLLTNNLSVDAQTNGTLSGTISGAGSLTKLSGGTLTVFGANTYSGGTIWGNPASQSAGGVISIGSSSIGAPGSITSGPLGTGTLTVRNSGVSTNNFIQSTDSTTRTISNAINFGGGGILFNVGGSGDLVFDGTVALGTGARTLTVNNSNTLFSGVISNSGDIAKTGSGTLTLSGSNSFSGQLSVQAGTLSIGSINNESANGVLGNSTNSVGLTTSVGQLATLRYTGGSASSNKKFDLGGGTGAIQVDTTATNLTLSGVISGGGNLRKTGTGTLTLSGSNTFTGALEVRAGSLAIGTINDESSVGVLGNSINSVGLGDLGATGTLQYTGGNASSTKNFTMASGGTGVFQVDSGATTLTLNGRIVGSGTSNLTKTGAGTLTLSGTIANTYSGITTVSAGDLNLNKTAGVNAIAGNVTIGGGTVKLLANNQIADASAITQTSGAFNLNGNAETITSYTKSGGTFTTGIGGSLTGTGATITFDGLGSNVIEADATVQDAHLVLTNGATVDVHGPSASGSGTNGGILQLNTGGAGLEMNGTSGNTINLSSDTNSTTAGKLILNGNVTIDGTGLNAIASVGAGTTRGIVDLATGTRVFTVNNTVSGTDLLVSATITNGGLTKSGAGSMQVTATNNYTGATSITGGALEVAGTGSIHNTSSVAVNSGGTLLISGGGNDVQEAVNNSATITLNGGGIVVGAAGLDETMGSLTLTASSYIDFGDFGNGNGSTLRFGSSTGLWGSNTLTVYNYSAGDHLFFAGQGLNPDQLGQIIFVFDNGSPTVSYQNGAFVLATDEVSPVPEPSSIAIGLGLVGIVGWRERKRFGGLFGRREAV